MVAGLCRLKKTRTVSSVYILVKEYDCVICIISVNDIINSMNYPKYFRSLARPSIPLAIKRPPKVYIYLYIRV